ncbi:hypothetical protein [Streptosporangium sp. NPDC051022]|uniref:hypothetical protein n=1 Tax=Streptosporangium sp. NPDC051022 TaxID=3155752 RepID=UPI003443A1ED
MTPCDCTTKTARAELRTEAAIRRLGQVADLAAQHLADTQSRNGRPPIVGLTAGGPAVAHLAELVLALTGPASPSRGGLWWPERGREDLWMVLLDAVRHRSRGLWELLTQRCVTIDLSLPGLYPPSAIRMLTLGFDGDDANSNFLYLNGYSRVGELLTAITGTRWDVDSRVDPPVFAELPTAPAELDENTIEGRVRHDIAARLRGQQQRCPDHPPGSGVRPSCQVCSVNFTLRAAEQIALGQWNPSTGQKPLSEVPEYGTPEYDWWIAGIRRAHQYATDGLGGQALEFLETAETLARRHPAATAADLAGDLAAAYPHADTGTAAEPAPPAVADIVERALTAAQQRIEASAAEAFDRLVIGDREPRFTGILGYPAPFTPQLLRDAVEKVRRAPAWTPHAYFRGPAEPCPWTGDGLRWEPKEAPATPARPSGPVRETKENPAPDAHPEDEPDDDTEDDAPPSIAWLRFGVDFARPGDPVLYDAGTRQFLS